MSVDRFAGLLSFSCFVILGRLALRSRKSLMKIRDWLVRIWKGYNTRSISHDGQHFRLYVAYELDVFPISDFAICVLGIEAHSRRHGRDLPQLRSIGGLMSTNSCSNVFIITKHRLQGHVIQRHHGIAKHICNKQDGDHTTARFMLKSAAVTYPMHLTQCRWSADPSDMRQAGSTRL